MFAAVERRRIGWVGLGLALSAWGCTISAGHAVRRFDDRRTAAAGPCESPEIMADRGGARPRQSLAIISAQCAPSKAEECRRELRVGACSVSADAIIEVTDRVTRRTRRMVGIAVAWTDDEAPAPRPQP